MQTQNWSVHDEDEFLVSADILDLIMISSLQREQSCASINLHSIIIQWWWRHSNCNSLHSFILQRASDQSHTCKWKRMYTTRPTGETNDGSLPLINRVSNYLIRWMVRRSDFSLKREVRDINEGSTMFSYLTSQTQCDIEDVHLPGMFCKSGFKSSESLD